MLPHNPALLYCRLSSNQQNQGVTAFLWTIAGGLARKKNPLGMIHFPYKSDVFC
jgi:hypothetical protein